MQNSIINAMRNLVSDRKNLSYYLLYSKNETRNLIGLTEVRPKPYGPPKSRIDLSSKVSSVFLKFSHNLLVAIQ